VFDSESAIAPLLGFVARLRTALSLEADHVRSVAYSHPESLIHRWLGSHTVTYRDIACQARAYSIPYLDPRTWRWLRAPDAIAENNRGLGTVPFDDVMMIGWSRPRESLYWSPAASIYFHKNVRVHKNLTAIVLPRKKPGLWHSCGDPPKTIGVAEMSVLLAFHQRGSSTLQR